MTAPAGAPAAVAAAGVLAAAAYAWWATGLDPFHRTAYVAVGLPVAAVSLLALLPRQAPALTATPAPPWRRFGTAPWLALLLAAAGVEAAGLALGGRSASWPTLSDTVDHLLRWHGGRFVLFLAWLAAGLLLAAGARRRAGAGA